MSSKIINYRCLNIDSSNRLWVGTVEGVFVSSPLPFPLPTTKPLIFNILLNNRREVLFEPDGFSFNDRSFVTLKVGVLDYPSVDFKLEMMLKGRDTAWQPVPRSGILILANMVSGEHTLLLRARRSGNYLTSEVLEWKFSVYRIWYTRIWVILLMAALLALMLWFGVHLYTLSLKRNNEKLERAVWERTRETLLQKERIEAQHLSIVQKNEALSEANTGLEKARAIAEEASETQKKFLAVMTHELRTPLHAVIGAAHLLIRNNPREDQHEELQILRFSAENLLSLINNILDFQKIENGKVALETIPFNLKNLVDEIVSALNIRAKEKGIELRCHLDERLPEHLLGDPLRLSQIINNLTGNAMKFTEQGYVAVDVIMKEQVGEDILADFFIRDTGIGMSRETLDSVFEIFVQGSSETTRKYGGTGLGLVITKKLLELYGSEIRVESEPGKGSCFSFSIRFREASGEEHKAPVSHKHYEFSRFNGQRILLVEDNLVNKMIAGKFLKDWDLSFDHAINGQVALTMVKEHYYDLILMDIQMPEMDGYQASSAIRALGSTYHASVPIIALTAAIRSDVSAMIFRSGMNDYISKPFNPVDLHQKLSNYLSIG
jgi:signal transduction histidine kinase